MARLWPLIVMMVLGSAAMAEPQPARLTLERIFASPDLAGPQPQALALSPDGTLLTSVRARPDERTRFDLWATDTATGAERMLLDSKRLGSGAELSEAAKMQRERDRSQTGKTGILSYSWSPDGTSLLVPLDGELFVARTDGSARKLEGTRDALNPTVSPKGGYIGFVRGQNLWVRGSSSGEPRQLTQGGGGTVHFGEAEFVAQEEMDRRTGYWWSPDERRIAVARFDEAPVKVFTRAAIGATGTRIYQQRYPAAGTDNVAIELWFYDPAGVAAPVKANLGEERDIYLTRVDWLADGSAAMVQRMSRDQRTLDVLRVDPVTGRSSVLFSERAGPKSWVNLSDAYRWLRDGSLIWRSERDGFGHLWRWRTGKWTQLTKGAWVVSALVGVDEAAERVTFLGNKDDVLEQQLYALDLKSGGVTRLTERGYSHGATANRDASRIIVTRSSPVQPPQTYLADAKGQRLRWVNENRVADAHPYATYLAGHRPTEFGTIRAADGSELHWKMITPPLEPGKRYPVFYQHYGGPHAQDVTRAWQSPLAQYWVSKGYVFFQLDNRGTANRGKAFEDAIWHAMGSVEVADQQRGAEYLRTLPFVDASRIATYGWSYGGYMSLKMLEAKPGTYAAAVAGAPVSDWRLYDTFYTERYMGDPRQVGAAYDASRAVIDPERIRDPLLLMHGMADDNVFLDNSTVVAAALQAANVPFEMMFYPGKAHGAARDIHVWTSIERFLDAHVTNKDRQ